MKRILASLLVALAGLTGSVAHAQTTNITASSLKMAGAKITTGLVTITPVNTMGIAIPFADGTGAQNGPTAFACQITAGAITGMVQPDGTVSGACAVPDATQTIPANILYQIQISDNSQGRSTSGRSYTLQAVVAVSGTNWALDKYGPPANTSATQTVQFAQGASTPSSCVAPTFFTNTTSSASFACVNGSYVALGGGSGGAVLPSSGFVFATSPTSARQATPADLATFLQSQTGCSTAGYLYSPLSGTCIPPASGGVTNSAPAGNLAASDGTNLVNSNIPSASVVTLAGSQALTNKSVNGVTLSNAGSSASFLNAAGGYTTPTSSAATLTPGAQFTYLLNEGSGSTITDTSGNGYTGTLGTSTAAPTWTPQGLAFNQATPYTSAQKVTLPAGACSGLQTIESVVNIGPLNPLSNTGVNNGAWIGSDDQSYLGLDYSYMGLVLAAKGTNVNSTPVDKVIGTHLVTWVMGTIYIDGVPQTASLSSATPAAWTETSACYLGQYYNGFYYFTGTLEGVAGYTTQLTQAQVANDYNYWKNVIRTKGDRLGDQNEPIQSSYLMFKGDSITHGQGVNYVTKNTFPAISSNLIGWNGPVFNFGISGETASTMVTDSTTYMTAKSRQYSGGSSVWIVEGGTNDVIGSGTTTTILNYLTSICTAAHAVGAKCVMNTIMPRGANTSPQLATIAAVNAGILADWRAGTNGFDQVADIGNDPVMGYLSTNATYFSSSDQIHPTAVGNAIISQREACAIDLAIKSTVPCVVKVVVPYTAVNIQNTGTTSQTLGILNLGPHQQVQNVTAYVNTPFTGTSLTALAATVGDTTGTASQYLASQSLFSTTSAAAQNASFVSANGTVQATLTATGGNLNALTAGQITYYVTVVNQP